LKYWPHATLQDQGWEEVPLHIFLHLSNILARGKTHVSEEHKQIEGPKNYAISSHFSGDKSR
jgi:hypothetical protein